MRKQIVTTAAAMAVTALMAFQPMTAFAATGNCGTGTYNTGCSTQVCQSYGCSKGNNSLGNAACAQNGSSWKQNSNCGQNGSLCSSARGCNTGSVLNANRKNLSGKNCSSPQMISYAIGNSGCRR